MLNEKSNQNEIKAIDFSKKMIELSKTKQKELKIENIEFLVMNGEDLKFNNNYFDFCIANFSVIFYPNIQKGISEIYRVLNTNGTLILSAWEGTTPFSYVIDKTIQELNINKVSTRVNILGKEEGMIKELKEAGFCEVEVYHESHEIKCLLDEVFVFYFNSVNVQCYYNDLDDEKKKDFEVLFKKNIKILFGNDYDDFIKLSFNAIIGIGFKKE
jgi:ubiquinone/menaquinone biosynthesis C-methylase UbiE